MELHYLLSLFLIIILFAQQFNGSLLSRFKNTHTYEPVQVDLDEPQQLEEMEERDPKLLRDLLEEVPELKIILNAIRNNNSQHTYYFAPTHHTDDNKKNQGYVPTTRSMREEIVKLFKNNNTSQTSTIRNQMIMQSNHSNTQIYPRNYTGRRWGLDFFTDPYGKYIGDLMASCYECGHAAGDLLDLPLDRPTGVMSEYFLPGLIPKSPLCHDAFDSPNWKARTIARYFRTKCYYNSRNGNVYTKVMGNPWFTYLGMTRHAFYEGFIYPMCYKRFLDVGRIYTQRGCRTWPPWPDKNLFVVTGTSIFATHRYRALEKAIGKNNRQETCMYSPAASLTPFARGISLFARYHVCFCNGKYCNSSSSATSSKLLTFLACTILIYCNF